VEALDGYLHGDTRALGRRSLVFVKQLQIEITQNTTLNHVMNQITNAFIVFNIFGSNIYL